MENETRRVVVTGLGVATSLGVDVATLWDNVVNGSSGVGLITQYDSSAFPVRIGGEVDLSLLPRSTPHETSFAANRTLRFAHWAAMQAWRDAGLDAGLSETTRTGVAVGAGGFPAVEFRLDGQPLPEIDGQEGCEGWFLDLVRARPAALSQHELGTVSSFLSRQFGLRGPSLTVQGACTSSTQSLGEAFHLIRSGRCDTVLAGGADSMLSIFCLAGFTLLGALSTHADPATAARPFDLTRNGFVLSEGAAMLVLESSETARRRGARIYAELLGYGSSSDCFRFTDVHPKGAGAVLAMQRALRSAALSPHQVDYINAHGTATPQNDRVETMAIRGAFGEHADRLAVSSTKSQLGHLICAAGAVEALLTVLTIHHGVIPPTINLRRRDPECDLDYVPLEARRREVRYALSNSFGFGGQNGTLAFGQTQ